MSNSNLLDDLMKLKSSSPQPPSKPQSPAISQDAKAEFDKWKQCCEDKAYEEGVPHLLKAADGGYSPAQSDMAFQLFKGRLIPNDIMKAEQYARAGAVQGHDGCQLWLGQILRHKGQFAEAVDWLTKSAAQGQGWSAFILGEMYEKGEGVPANLDEAVRWYKISARTTNAYGKDAKKALDRLGIAVYEEGEYMEAVLSVQITPGLSVEDFYNHGRFWDNLQQPEQLAYLIAAANNGHPEAAKQLSDILVSDDAKSYGFYSPQASAHYFQLAKDNFKKLADAGDAEAMSDYAWMIKDENNPLAMQYLERGANMGNDSCQLQLGRIYLDRRMYDKAMYWLTKSAEQGQGWAALLVGQMYENGEGTMRNISKAKYWYQVSVDSKNYYGQYAQECLDRLAATGGGGIDLGAIGDAVDEINGKLSDIGDTISSGLKSLFGRFKK